VLSFGRFLPRAPFNRTIFDSFFDHFLLTFLVPIGAVFFSPCEFLFVHRTPGPNLIKWRRFSSWSFSPVLPFARDCRTSGSLQDSLFCAFQTRTSQPSLWRQGPFFSLCWFSDPPPSKCLLSPRFFSRDLHGPVVDSMLVLSHFPHLIRFFSSRRVGRRRVYGGRGSLFSFLPLSFH